MTFSLEEIQDDWLDAIRAGVVQEVVEQSIPDWQTLARNEEGDFEPYYAVQFGDLSPGRTTSLAGPWGDDYRLPFYAQAVAPTPEIARQMINKLMRVILGLGFTWSGQIRKRPTSGGAFGMKNPSGAIEAYIMPTSYDVLVQLMVS